MEGSNVTKKTVMKQSADEIKKLGEKEKVKAFIQKREDKLRGSSGHGNEAGLLMPLSGNMLTA